MLALCGVHLGRPMKLPRKSIVLPHVGITWYRAFHRTLVIPWNCPCKAIVLSHIGLTWGLHWSAHEIAHVKPLFCHILALHGVHIGRLMKLPIYKPLFYHTLVLHEVYSGWAMKLHMKSNCFSPHWQCMGFTLVDSWKCPYKETALHTLE